MTPQGQPLTRYHRAIQSRSILLAELSAREAGRLPLEEALALVALYAHLDDAKFDRAAVRWLARLVNEKRLTLAQVQAAAAGALSVAGRRGVGYGCLASSAGTDTDAIVDDRQGDDIFP